jgi:type IV pilus secretin PilQ/predicted competence protein
MKLKTFALIILVLSLIGFLEARVAITDVEYLAGKDFVQLRFITDEIIPIPDLFYPQKDDYELIVMRIKDVDASLLESKLEFDSPIIENVNIVPQEAYIDVEIRLKDKVNYRVFTNQNGLYIEFPNIKKGTSPKTRSQQKTKEYSPPESSVDTNMGGDRSIQDVRISKREPGEIELEILMSRKADYKVIPIPETPVRLAIDLKDTRSTIIKREINHLNVKTLRGAYNSPDVFRLVFDLHYLKNYRVRFEGNKLKVAFFNQSEPDDNIVAVSDVKDSTEMEPETSSAISAPADEKPTGTSSLEQAEQAKPLDMKGTTEEFFTEEKSQVTAQEPPGNFVSVQDDQGNSQVTYLQQTIQSGEKKYSGDLYDFNFKDADLINVLKFIARIAGLNMMIDPGVSGRVTSELFQVPWDQALELFLKVNGLDMVLEGNILRIGKADVLARESEQRRKLREAREMEGELTTTIRSLSYAKGTQLLAILKKQLTQRGEILVDDRSNTLIISEVPERIKLLDTLIDALDTPNAQVSIEARIVETTGNFEQGFGIQWGYNMIADAAYGNQTTLKFPNSVQVVGDAISNIQNPGMPSTLPGGGYAINLPAAGRTSGTTFSLGNVANTFRLDMALSAMERQGKGKIISAPKTVTQNNMEAILQQGQQIPVQTIQNNTVTVQYIPAALELKVTPQITAKGTVIMTLDIKNNAADFANLVNGIPPITTQTIKTSVMANDGGTIVIGGMYRIEDSVTRDSVPLLSRIPILGNLFKNKSRFGKRRELLVFITPRIVK